MQCPQGMMHSGTAVSQTEHGDSPWDRSPVLSPHESIKDRSPRVGGGREPLGAVIPTTGLNTQKTLLQTAPRGLRRHKDPVCGQPKLIQRERVCERMFLFPSFPKPHLFSTASETPLNPLTELNLLNVISTGTW